MEYLAPNRDSKSYLIRLRACKYQQIPYIFQLARKIILYFMNFPSICSKIHIFTGALEENLITKNHLIASRPYYHDCLTWCVQKHQPIPRWQSAFYLCTDSNVYVAFTLFAFFTIGTAYYLQKSEPDKKDWHYITLFALTICIGYSHPYQPQARPTRVLVAVGQFAGTIFFTVLSSMLLLRVSVPHFMPQIDSIAEITKGDFILAGDRFAFQKISQQNEVAKNFFLFKISQ